MAANGPDTNRDKRIDSLAERLSEELVDGSGSAPDPQHVAEVVHAKAKALEDAPIQDFVPLLVENEAVDELRAEGLRRNLPEDSAALVSDPADPSKVE